MTDIPSWLWQGMTIWAAGKSIEWAWKHRRALHSKAVQLSGVAEGTSDAEATLRIVKDVDLRWKVHSRVSKDADLRWKVEAPTPSLARRLENLALWYLRVS